MLNNIIGGDEGGCVGNSRKDMAIGILISYHTYGIWVANKQLDGTYKISRERLSDEQYFAAKARLEELDDDGYSEEDRRKRDQ